MTTQQDKDDLHRFDPKMRPQTAPAFEYQWHDPRRAPMQIAGLAWFAQEGLLRRMPAKPAWKLPEAVDSLSDQLPGAQIRFRSNTRLVAGSDVGLPEAACTSQPSGRIGSTWDSTDGPRSGRQARALGLT
jgi:hypothetical protein